jgi:VWFA-related protein
MRPAALILVGSLGAGASVVAQQAVFRLSTDVVVIDAAVSDGRKPVGDLTRDDFEVRDNGVVQDLLDFGRETMPLDVTMAIDVSGSMSAADRLVVERAVTQVSEALSATDRARVLTFSTVVGESTPLSHPPITVNLSAIGSGTAVLDALLLSMITPPVVDRRHYVLFMTDGEDRSSSFTAEVVSETARHATAPITIVLVPNRAKAPMRALLAEVSDTTGGELIELTGNRRLSETFLAALQNFRTSYVLRYIPKGVSRAGWHDLTISVKNRRYDVRARQGYVAQVAEGF